MTINIWYNPESHVWNVRFNSRIHQRSSIETAMELVEMQMALAFDQTLYAA